jgi:chitodextrinase
LSDTPLAQLTSNSYSDTIGLAESTTYYYKIAAVDNSGNIGVLSDEKSATTLDSTAPSKVLGLNVTPVSSNQLDLTWTANTEPDLARYRIYRSTTSGFTVNFTSDIPIAQPTVNSYSDIDNLSASTTYYYRIVAVDTSGNIGEISDEGSATTIANPGDTTPPSKVVGVNVTPINSGRIDLTWTLNTESDLDHYNVYRSTTTGFIVNTSTPPLAQSATNTYSDTGLPQSTTYYYKVAAVDTTGNMGNVSDEKSGTTFTQIFYTVPIPGNAAGAALNNTSTGSLRYGVEAFGTSSILIGKLLKSWKVRLRRSGTPSGMITAKIRKNDVVDTVVATFNETIDSTSLSTSYVEYTFTLTNPYTIQKGDRIMLEYGGPPSVNIDIWNVDKFDGSNTRRIRYSTTIGNAGSNTEDVAGTMSTE